MFSITQIAQQARNASYALASLTTTQKNQALLAMADALHTYIPLILAANQKDLMQAQQNQLPAAIQDRLKLDEPRLINMENGIHNVVNLADPVGVLLEKIERDNGLTIKKIRVPIGVIAVIYEARPNVTTDVAALCLKAGNAIILRGGKEAWHSNNAIVNALNEGLKNSDLPPHALQWINTTDHQAVKELVQAEKYIDLVIPRGGENLINAVMADARVPVIKHYKGVCHVYVDDMADLTMALAICENAKCQRPGVCNAMETLLVHEKIAPTFLPELVAALKKYAVEWRGDETARNIVPTMQTATAADWEAEYLDYILAVKVVKNVDAAIKHINQFGSHHSDSIISNSSATQQKFLQEVDSAVVYVNASTRFTDGAEFGMGAEIGISTDKLHARGPMGLAELTTYKYLVFGSGQIRN